MAFIDEVKKPIVVTWNSFKTDEQGFTTLVDAGVPMFRSFRNCFAALRAFAALPGGVVDVPGPQDHCRAASPRRRRPCSPTAGPGPRPPGGRRARGDCSSPSASPWPVRAVAHSAAEAARLAGGIGFPVVMKIASPDFPHKSDAGLVRLSVGSASEARAVYTELVERATEGQAQGPHRGRADPGADRGRHRDDRGRHPRPGVRARRAGGHGRRVRRDPEGRGRAPAAPRPARRPGDGRGRCAATPLLHRAPGAGPRAT